MDLDEIIVKDENIDNIYEKYKIIYRFNQIFPNLKNIQN